MLMCPKCNFQVSDDASFCPNCGVPFIVQSNDTAAETTVLTKDMYSAKNEQTQYAQGNPNQVYSQPYSQPQMQQNTIVPPMNQLRTNRSFIKTLLLSLVTFGIYGLVCYGHITDDVNLVCSRYDGKKSMNYYLLFFLVGPITFEIATIVWLHNLCNRIGNELKRRMIDYNFSASDFWLWGVLGSLIIVGPFVFCHKFFTAVNKMNESFNSIG